MDLSYADELVYGPHPASICIIYEDPVHEIRGGDQAVGRRSLSN
jgi:hypothetical protein